MGVCRPRLLEEPVNVVLGVEPCLEPSGGHIGGRGVRGGLLGGLGLGVGVLEGREVVSEDGDDAGWVPG